jgi:hypothetical protein
VAFQWLFIVVIPELLDELDTESNVRNLTLCCYHKIHPIPNVVLGFRFPKEKVLNLII